MFIYTVRPGDSVYSISRLFDVGTQQIVEENQLKNPELLVIGQALVISADSVRHTVAPGETLSTLALRYQVSIPAILRANPDIVNPSLILAGQVVTIPSPAGALGATQVNGYAFPNISENTLELVMPGLTYCSIFSYQVNANGSLTTISDDTVIKTVRSGSVAPMMVITNIIVGGGFSSSLAHSVLSSDTVQKTLLDNVL